MRVCPSCGACFEDEYDLCAYDGGMLRELFPGTRVLAGRYLLEQHIAAGAMGTVFRATHLQIGSVVAVKIMQPERDALRVGLARFHREAQILGQIKHPNAVLVMDFGVEERPPHAVPYLVTEFLRGEPLSALLARQQRLSLEEIVRIVSSVCEAVEEAHQVGVIHRDLKPSNIFIEQLRDGSEVVKVLDFGIAKFVELAPDVLERLRHDNAALAMTYRQTLDVDLLEEVAEVRSGERSTRLARPEALGGVATEPPSEWTITEAGFMIGTIPYMAPEQMTGERVSRQTDIYGIATLLFHLVTGRLPFDGDDDEIILGKLGEEPPSMRAQGAEVPEALDRLVQAAMALDPADRPDSALDLSAALQAALSERRREEIEDAPRDLAAQLAGLARAAQLVNDEVADLNSASDLEESYQRVRDRLLGLGAPIERIGQLLEQLPRELTGEQRRRLGQGLDGAEAALEPIGRALHGLAADRGNEFLDYASAIWTKAQLSAALRLDRLRDLVVDEPGSSGGLAAPADLFAGTFAGDEEHIETLAVRLTGGDSLDRHEAFEALIADELGNLLPFLAQGTHRSSPTLELLVGGLWHSADTLLLLELFPRGRAPRLLPLLTTLAAVDAAQPFVQLGTLFSGQAEGQATALQRVEGAVDELSAEDEQRGLWRCLLAHPADTVRALAAERLDLSDFWNVAVYARTPIRTLRTIFERVIEPAPPEYLKVFFLCVRERLLAATSADDLEECFGLLGRFFSVPCFHEDVVFEPLLEVDRALRERRRSCGLPESSPGDYDDRLADFYAEGAVESESLVHMRDIPLPIQRMLAREGVYLDHFISHPNERVARETLPHLMRREDVTRFLRIVTIHRAVLVELSRQRRFFRKQSARLALLQNPKTSAQVARHYLPLVSHEHVRLLAKNKHVGADVRGLARAYLERLKRRTE